MSPTFSTKTLALIGSVNLKHMPPELKDKVEIADGIVRTVRLSSFRNYDQLDLDLDEGFNVVSGPNAQGKTNLLEAIYLLGTTRLLRGRRETEAIRDSEDVGYAEAELGRHRTTVRIRLERHARKRALLNGLALPRAADILGRLPVVCVSAADMEIVRGEPAERRLFLDLEISSLSPAYLRHLSVYKRALEHRNALLRRSREAPVDASSFEPWEVALAHHGAALREMRRDFLGRLEHHVSEAHAALGEGERISLAMIERDEAGSESAFLAALEGQRDAEVLRGSTGTGPHRDDLEIGVEGRDARAFGSQGQQRTAVIALKLGTLENARELLGAPPILLLDDILSDLDERRRRALVERVLDRAGQAVLTCTEAEAAGPEVLRRARVFRVHAGTVVQT